MTASTTGERAVRNHGWSPELLTVLGAVLAIGVGLAGLMMNMQGQIREDMRSMEAGIREDMRSIEVGIREDMRSMEAGIRGDMQGMEAGIRGDMQGMEAGIRGDMRGMETRIREDVRELRSDAGDLRERVSHLEGHLIPEDAPIAQPGGSPPPTSPS